MKSPLLFIVFAMMMLVSARAQITTVGLIGSATPGGWDVDTNMVQDPDSAHLWTMSINLIAGDARFRANDAWDINWSFFDFPVGVGISNGPNIIIPTGGDFTITFNSNTGAYHFSVTSDIGIIGSAAPFGWDADVNMFQSGADTNEYYLTLLLAEGEAKFRQNDAWDINWGASDFPSGTGVQDGPNIPIPLDGDYLVNFNKSTGAYNFQILSFSTIGIIGDATPGGWDTPTPMTQLQPTPKIWSISAQLVDGGLQFSGDNGVAIFGGSDFPSGTATAGGDTIPVQAGTWVIEFNSLTGAYNFFPLEIYATVGIIGDATPGGWVTDTDMEHEGLDPSDWKMRVTLTDGEAKFRANDDWAVNWGSIDFPVGTAVRDGANIPIIAGEYNVVFNSFSGYYVFVEVRVFSSMGLIGPATPFGDWYTDVVMTKDAKDENLWKLQSVDLVDGEAKFRAEGAWTVNWGSTDWPTGISTQDGPNIPITGGTYGVTLNSETGEYAFGDPLTSTKDLLDPSSIKVFPNPVSELLHIDVSAIDMRGEVNLNVYDIHGKLVLSDVQLSSPQMQLGVAALQDGFYTLQISNDKYIIGKKFVIAR